MLIVHCIGCWGIFNANFEIHRNASEHSKTGSVVTKRGKKRIFNSSNMVETK